MERDVKEALEMLGRGRWNFWGCGYIQCYASHEEL